MSGCPSSWGPPPFPVGDWFSVDFDTGGNIRGARAGVGIASKITYQARRYYLVYKKYYVLAGEGRLGDIPKGVLASQKTGKAGHHDSDFSFGAIRVPRQYQDEIHVLDMVRVSGNSTESLISSNPTPPPGDDAPIWQQYEDYEKDFFWAGQSVRT